MKDDMVYKAAMTCTKEELAGMYSLALKREQDLQKEIKSLRLILKSHGEIIEINSELRKENTRLRDFIKDMVYYVGVNYWIEEAKFLLGGE